MKVKSKMVTCNGCRKKYTISYLIKTICATSVCFNCGKINKNILNNSNNLFG